MENKTVEYIIEYPTNMEKSNAIIKQELIRCNDCKHYHIIGGIGSFGWCERYGRNCTNHWFCADGQRKDSK